MTFPLRVPALLSALTLMALGGCSSQSAPTASTLTGTIAQATFASPVKKITVTNDKGQSSTATVGAHGEFSISLKQGATYQLFLSDDGKSAPVILNSEQGLSTTVHVKSGGASVDIGSVRFWPGDLNARTALKATLSTNNCVNGVVEGLTKPCASGAAAAKCAENDDEDGDHQDGDHQDGDHQDSNQSDSNQSDSNQSDSNQSDSNQSDSNQTASPSQAILANAHQAMGVPERNIAGDLGCEESDDDGDDSHDEGD